MTRASVYERVTEGIVRELEQGVAPWAKPWSGGGNPMVPYNATTQRRYRGVNVLLLWDAALTNGYRSNAWLTFRQALGSMAFRYFREIVFSPRRVTV
jgi:antirestriction protein ArdC